MKKILLIAIITMLATMGFSAVDPVTTSFDITAVKDYSSDSEDWAPCFSYEELYESEGEELLNGHKIEINPAQLKESLDLFRVNYITNDSMRQVTMTVTTEPFSNETAGTIAVTYHFSDAVYVKGDGSAEWTKYEPQSDSSWYPSWSDTEYTQTKDEQSSETGSTYSYPSPALSRVYDYGWFEREAALPYDSVKYALTVAVEFSNNDMSDDDLKNLAGTYELPVTVTITSED